MESREILLKAAELLKEKFSFIEDFDIYLNSDHALKGGFNWCNVRDCAGDWIKTPIHEVFCNIFGQSVTVEEIVNDCSNSILKGLAISKMTDEKVAKGNNKPVSYRYDYSIIDGLRLTYTILFSDKFKQEFNDEDTEMCESLDYCMSYIRAYNGTGNSFFGFCKGGTVKIMCNEDKAIVFEEKIV